MERIADQREDRVAPKHVMVVLVWIVRDDAVDTHTCHVEERVIDVPDVPPIDQSLYELSHKPDLLIELAEGEQPAIFMNHPYADLPHLEPPASERE